MKSVNKPVPTGEQKFRRVTGTQMIERIEKSSETRYKDIEYSLIHGGDSLLQRNISSVKDSVIQFNLLDMVDPDRFEDLQPDSLQIQVGYEGKMYRYQVAVSEFLTPYVQVKSDFAKLHNRPAVNDENVLTDLARGSMLELVRTEEKSWYEVKFGLKNTYIQRSDVSIVWRPGSFEQKESIVTLDNIPFGEIDVESNIPILSSNNSYGLGFVFAAENYSNPFSARKYAGRDARLLKLYMDQSLGYRSEQVYNVDDPTSVKEIREKMQQMAGVVEEDSSQMTIFLSGQAIVRESDGQFKYLLVPPGLKNPLEANANQYLDLEQFFSQLSGLETYQTVVFADIEFLSLQQMLEEPENVDVIRPLAGIARQLTENHTRSAVIFSSRFNQKSHVFYKKGEVDNKHRIFPYFVADGLQRRITNIRELMNYLERNVNYTARKYHESPQNPQFFGNDNISLIPE
jgi:hypothetical protein